MRKFRSIVEGTKWVDERFSSRAKKTDAQIRQLQNQNSSLLFEITKIDNMDPKEDIGSTKLYVDQGARISLFLCSTHELHALLLFTTMILIQGNG